MSSLLSAELSATCNALGYFDEKANKYFADSNTLETVKDLIRYLRRDDETHDIRRFLGETEVLQTDLLPLLKSYWEQTDLFDVLLRLLVNLTTPALMLWNEEIPTDKTIRNHYMQIEDHLQHYKQAFADEAVWAVLSTRLSKILEIDYSERGDENSLIIERILILIRNILYVPTDPAAEKRPDNDASVHDQVLWALHQSGMLDIILYISGSPQEQAYYMHVLEILSFLLREQKASELAHAALQRNQTEKIRDEAELLAIRRRETIQRQQKAKIYSGARHSRFGGTFVVKSMKSISDNELIYHKPLNKLDALNFDADKKKPKTPKNRMPVQSSTTNRRSAFSIRLFLKEFCIEFLNGAYNSLMYHVKDVLARAKAQTHDESYYLWALRFFMEFNRSYKFEVKLVSETMSVQTFHYVQQQMENYFDMMQTDKKKLLLWSKRLHLALLAYRELLQTICVMDKSSETGVKDSAKVIKSNIFYVLEYRELVITLLVTYDELKMSDVYLNDLLETQHIFLKMFEAFCNKDGTVIVQQKSKSKRRKKKGASEITSTPEFNLEDMWDEISPQLSSVLESNQEINSDVVPFDAASDIPIDEQKADAMLNIQRKLRSQEFETAIALLRAAREVWPENDSFGSSNMAPEEEFLAMKEIFFVDLGENTIPRQLAEEQPIYNANDEEEDDEDEEGFPNISEANLKFEEFAKRLCNPKVVRACGLALKNFEKNTPYTNHCIIKLLHRIAFDNKMYVMVLQVSIFITFQKIFALKELPEYKELVKFGKYIISRFIKVAEINKKVYMEALFWKTSREAYDIEEGYGSYQEKSAAASKVWSEQEEDELRRLFMEHSEKQLSDDVVDWIVNNLIDNTRSRRAVMKKLKEMYLLTDYKGRKSASSTRVQQRQWGEEEEEQLRELFEQFKDAMDPLSCIMDRLDVPRPKNRIVEKLLVMGLIQDKKEVRKKRAKKSRSGPQNTDSGASSLSEDGDSDDGDFSGNNINGATSSVSSLPKPARKTNKHKKKTVRITTASKSELVKLILKIVELGMIDALEWLKESFSDAVEDFEDDNEEGVPIVPIMDYSSEAMENADFRTLLKGFGITEPFDEQETYWRIPPSLSKETLQSHCSILEQAIDGSLALPTEEEPNNTRDAANSESSDDDVFERLRRITRTNDEQNVTQINNEQSQEDILENISRVDHAIDNYSDRSNVNEESNIAVDEPKSDSHILAIRDESPHHQQLVDRDSESDTASNFIASEGKNSAKKKYRSRIASDSDEDDENKEKKDEQSSQDLKRMHSLSDSDTEKPKGKRTRIIDSDSE